MATSAIIVVRSFERHLKTEDDMKNETDIEKLETKLAKYTVQTELANQKLVKLCKIINSLVDSLSFDDSITERQYNRIKTELNQIESSLN
jgi:hypothetical protein